MVTEVYPGSCRARFSMLRWLCVHLGCWLLHGCFHVICKCLFLFVDVLYIPCLQGKYVEATGTPTMSSSGTLVDVGQIARGATVNTRIGQRFCIVGFELQGYTFPDSAFAYDYYAIDLVWDRYPNKAYPAITDIFTLTDATGLQKVETMDRFQLLYSWRARCVGQLGVATTSNESVHVLNMEFSFEHGAYECVTTAADTTGVINNRISGAMYLVFRGVRSSATDATSYISLRTWFSDYE